MNLLLHATGGWDVGGSCGAVQGMGSPRQPPAHLPAPRGVQCSSGLHKGTVLMDQCQCHCWRAELTARPVGNTRWEQLQCAAEARSCNLSFPCQAFSVCVIIAVIAAVVIAKEKGVCFKSEQPRGREIVMCRKDALLLFSMEWVSAWRSLFGAHTSCFVSQSPAVSRVPSPALTRFLQKEDSFLICCFSKGFFPTDRNFKGTLLHPFPLAELGALWSVFAAEHWVVVFGWKQKLGQEEHRSSSEAAGLPPFFQGPPPFTN